MTTHKTTACWSLFFLLAISCPLAQGTSPQDVQKSCRDFVQGFYDWYVPKALRETKVPASDLAVEYKGSVFSPELLQALREDSDVRAKAAAGQIVSLDFDPFLYSQDPSERYVAGGITVKGDRYWVEVYSVSSGKKSPKPVVVPELTLKAGRWIFVNFHYGNSKDSGFENLVSLLKNLRRAATER